MQRQRQYATCTLRGSTSLLDPFGVGPPVEQLEGERAVQASQPDRPSVPYSPM